MDERNLCGTRFRGIGEEFSQELVRLAVAGVVEINSLGFVNVAFDAEGALVTDCKTNIFIRAMRSMFGVEPEYLYSLDEYGFKTRDEAVTEANLERLTEALGRFGRSDLCILTYNIPISCSRSLPDLIRNIQLFFGIFTFPNDNDTFVIHTDPSFIEGLERAFNCDGLVIGKQPVISLRSNTSHNKSFKRMTKLLVKVKLSYIQKLVPEFNKFIPAPILTISSLDEASDVFTDEQQV
ncbi:hypothetical protein GMRT_11041 [Giardia muris]|uniref:Uncharacterized protein n=1 Tax=Giardia muris TaxID=5742 RepID=A0A4Z1T434_GIAMU|nr:hypothetical protein GMRT_11041 [Giardia muris]|eukprot:TNJ27171.1 hypothetical protein GMRT_11041 [Giardia muris]